MVVVSTRAVIRAWRAPGGAMIERELIKHKLNERILSHRQAHRNGAE